MTPVALLGPLTVGAVEDTGSARIIDEIIVSATRREQSLQDVPASISALTTEDIEQRGLDSYADFARSLPGVTLNQPIKNRSFFNIRGLATSVAGGNTQDPVAVYINDMPVTDTFGASVQPDLRLYDIERVEVLRGPQGTLFGSGSLGGTVRVITNKPKLDAFDGSLRVDFADTEDAGLRQRYDAMVNVPLVDDRLALRAVGYYRDEDGWVDNVTLGTDNSFTDWGGRVALRWQASDRLTATVEVLHQDSDPDDGDAWNPALGKFTKSATIAEGRPSKLTSYNATLEYDIPGFATLTSSTSYNESETAVLIDYGDITGLGFPLLAQNAPWEVDFFSQELRLVSRGPGPWDWVLGGFYIERESNADFSFVLPGLADFINSLVAPGFLEGDSFLTTTTTTKSEELAAFGEATYHFNEHWSATGGLRVASAEVSTVEPARSVLNFGTFARETSAFSNEGKDDSIVTGRAVLSYEPADNLLFYGSISTGYRIGQPNPFVGASPVDPDDPLVIPNLYDPDETTNYELGAKTRLLDDRLQLNAAVFYIEWTDIQVDAIRLSDTANYIANAGEAVSQGVELELRFFPVDGLELNAAVTLLDAEVDRINPADSLRSGVVEGDALPGSPDYQLSVGARYDWTTARGHGMYAQIAAQFVDSSPNGFSNQAGTLTPNPFYARNASYEQGEVSVGMIVNNWELTLYGENLSDNDDFILNGGGATPSYVNTLRPRTVGARLHYRY
jgi:outer membrane receptor protein involved in Fe transport